MLKGYSEYKDVESNWINKIPIAWGFLPLQSQMEERKEKNDRKQTKFILSLTAALGVIPYSEKKSGGNRAKEDITKYNIAMENDLIINCMNVVAGSSGISKYYGAISPVYYALHIRNKNSNIKYWEYIFRNQKFYSSLVGLGNGILMKQSSSGKLNTVRKRIPMTKMNRVMLPVPPKSEQDKIVQFLDWKTSEMNRFINQKKKQIKLLEELKRNIIDDLITNGKKIEKQVKISKAKWMGDVPFDWKEYRLKNLFQEINVRSELGLEPHLSMSQKKGLVTDDEDIERRLLSESYAGAKLCEKDDLVLNRLKAHLGVFALAPMKGIVSPDYTVLRINTKRVIPKYLEYLLKSNACRRELVTRVRGIVEGFWRLYTEDLGEIPVCIPNIEEQKAILEVILEKTNNIDEMISGINKEIILVEELRTKLISDVVTGQVDVRDVKIPIYEAETDIIDSEDDTDEENPDESMEE